MWEGNEQTEAEACVLLQVRESIKAPIPDQDMVLAGEGHER